MSAESSLDQALITTGQELASSHGDGEGSPRFEVIVEGERRKLAPMAYEEIFESRESCCEMHFSMLAHIGSKPRSVMTLTFFV